MKLCTRKFVTFDVDGRRICVQLKIRRGRVAELAIGEMDSRAKPYEVYGMTTAMVVSSSGYFVPDTIKLILQECVRKAKKKLNKKLGRRAGECAGRDFG